MTNKAISRVDQLNNWFSNPDNIEKLRSYFESEKALHSFLSTIRKICLTDEKLKSYSVGSVLSACVECAELGLSPQQSRGLVYFTPYKGQLKLSIGYKGWIHLLDQAGKHLKAFNVYKCDRFNFKFEGLKESITYEPDFDAHCDDDSKWVGENLKGVLVVIEDFEKSASNSYFVNKKKLDQIKSVSPSIKKGKTSPWSDWAAEMYKAKAIKYIVSKTPINDRIAQAIEKETELEKINLNQGHEKKKIDVLEMIESE